MATNQDILVTISARFGGHLRISEAADGQLVITAPREEQMALLRFLKEENGLQFDYLMDLFGVDYLEMGGEERYGVIFSLYSRPLNHRVRVHIWVPEQDPHLESVTPLWSAANWAEREVYDMYGITFTGHPNMSRILCPDDFSGFPLRKDFPLQGIGYRENFEKIENPKTKQDRRQRPPSGSA
ncbi:MAG TPA: NADH-quinone oxidoreductase subunit C [bacterium]|nr:NADH-quinone oxidoreductase subunit C [bacterium]HQI50012.1 NADH-quinone oxidoreductase subunit C [bacterium]HQJ63935.1 NADH-quinone oxidoreductase subunit C [bacterium]